MRRLMIAVFTLVLSMASVAALAAEKKTIFYNITTDEAWAAGMALGQANKVLEHGYGVVIFLNVRAVFIASKAFKTDANGATGKSLQEMLRSAMDKGATAIVCPMCLGKAGLTMDDVLDGILKGGIDTTIKALTADDTVVLSY